MTIAIYTIIAYACGVICGWQWRKHLEGK